MRNLLRFFLPIALIIMLNTHALGQLVWIAEHVGVSNLRGVNSVAFSPDGAYLASGSDDVTVRLWDVSTGQEAQRPEAYGHSFESVAFSSDGRYLAALNSCNTSACASGFLWDLTTGERNSIRSGYRWTSNIAFMPRLGFNSYMAAGGSDGTVYVWNRHRVLNRFWRGDVNYPSNIPEYLAFDPSTGGNMIVGYRDGTVIRWNVFSGEELYRQKKLNSVYSVAFSGVSYAVAGERLMQSDSSYSQIYLWSSIGGEPVLRIPNTRAIVSIALYSLVHDDGDIAFEYLASGSADGMVQVYKIGDYDVNFTNRSWEKIHQFEGHKSIVNSVAFSPDGAYLASGSDDGTVRLWKVGGTNTTLEVLSDIQHPITLYPNPAESFVTVEYVLSEVNAVQLSVRDIIGRKVLDVLNRTQPAGSHRLQINTNKLADGAYFLHLVTDGKSTTRPLLIR